MQKFSSSALAHRQFDALDAAAVLRTAANPCVFVAS
jgi:hypothetical protein